MTQQLSGTQMAELFDTAVYASSFAERVRRGFELGPGYYFREVPRYLLQRRQLGLGVFDWGVLKNPSRSFRAKAYAPSTPPPQLQVAYAQLHASGVRFDLPELRVRALAERWWSARGARGDVIECGALRGASSLLLAVLGRLNNISQQVLLLDTFKGMPEPSRFDSARNEGEYSPPAGWPARLRAQAASLGVADRVEVHEGLFAETFEQLGTKGAHYAFAHIDANIYPGTLEACEFTLSRMSPGSVIVLDDYNGLCDLGARLAIDQALRPTGLAPVPLAECSAYLQF